MISIYSKIMNPDELALRLTKTYIEFSTLATVNPSLRPKSYEKINDGKTYCLLDIDNSVKLLELTKEQQNSCTDIPLYLIPSVSAAKEYVKELNR